MSRTVLRARRLCPGRAALICGVLIVLSPFAAAAPAAAADVVIDWNVVLEAVVPRFGGPQQQSRVQAMTQIAVHDALNTIDPRYARYTDSGPMRPGASPDAAVASPRQGIRCSRSSRRCRTRRRNRPRSISSPPLS